MGNSWLNNAMTGLIKVVPANKAQTIHADGKAVQYDFTEFVPEGYTCLTSYAMWTGSGYGLISRMEHGIDALTYRLTTNSTTDITFNLYVGLVCVKSEFVISKNVF